MANTALSHVAPKVALSVGGETRVAAFGDGTAKPGDFVGLTSAKKVVQTAVGASEPNVGILDINVETDMDTPIVDGVPCEIIIPRSTHVYNCHIEDPAGTKYEGEPFTFSNTAGTIELATTAVLGQGGFHAATTLVTGDTYGKMRKS